MWKVRPEGDTVHKEAPGGRSGLGTRSHPNTLSNFCWFVSFPSFFPFFYRRKTSLGHTGRATADIEKRGEWPCPRVRLSPTPPLCWVESAPAQPGPWGSVCVWGGGGVSSKANSCRQDCACGSSRSTEDKPSNPSLSLVLLKPVTEFTEACTVMALFSLSCSVARCP